MHELTDSILGDNYPVPDRMLIHAELVARRYLDRAMFDRRPPSGAFRLFAVEGATAAMCYVFKSLFSNHILKKGDTIALGTPAPTFTTTNSSQSKASSPITSRRRTSY